MSAAARRHAVLDQIAAAARLARREPADVRLIAVSKGRSVDEIAELIAAGQVDFGENRLQEVLAKWPALLAAHPGIRLHFVGRLQSNKVADACRSFDVLHSLDRTSLIAPLAAAQAERPQLFVQVNVGEEEQKGGCPIAELPVLLDQAGAAGLTVAGLMAIPPQGLDAAPYFALLAKLAERHGLARLSMGMSDDFRSAVMLGATDVRIGAALFEQ